jgi:hypothetical protein
VAQVWRKSKKCANLACIEISSQPDAFLVRDSKDSTGPVLTFTQPAWGLFIQSLKANPGENV